MAEAQSQKLDLIIGAAVAAGMQASWYSMISAYQENEARNRQRATLLADICHVSPEEMRCWQAESGLSWHDFWQLANTIVS